MSIYVRPFKVSDLNTFELLEPLSEPSDMKFTPEFSQAVEDSGLSVTGVRDGKVIGCGGVIPIDDFFGQAWLRLSKECMNFKIDTMRWLRDGMEVVEQGYPFEQINTVVKSCFAVSVKMVERLGFGLVGEKMFNGEKWLMYSKRIQDRYPLEGKIQ